MLPSTPYLLLRPANVVAAAAGASLALDGTPQTANSGAATTLALPAFTTTLTNNVVVVAVATNGPTTTAPTSANLTFARATGLTPPNSGSQLLDLWYAIAASPLANEVVTANTSSNAFVTALVFAVNGAKTAAPFDVSGPTTTTSGTYATLTTTAANTFGIGLAVISATTPGSGWTNMSATALTNFLLLDYQIFSAAQTGTVFDTGGTGTSMALAIVKGP